jgi:hypothetical protein
MLYMFISLRLSVFAYFCLCMFESGNMPQTIQGTYNAVELPLCSSLMTTKFLVNRFFINMCRDNWSTASLYHDCHHFPDFVDAGQEGVMVTYTVVVVVKV